MRRAGEAVAAGEQRGDAQRDSAVRGSTRDSGGERTEHGDGVAGKPACVSLTSRTQRAWNTSAAGRALDLCFESGTFGGADFFAAVEED